MNRFRISILIYCLLTCSLAGSAIKLSPTPLEGLPYQGKLLQGNYLPAIATPQSLLGFEIGSQAASPAQIVQCITQWSESSDRAILVEYARSHENRPLYYVIISSPDNLNKIDQIKQDLAQLADPRSLTESASNAIIEKLPAVAWMAYSIHGNESSGADSALATIYHLLASTDDDVNALLKKEIIIIDPSMNPDGRARFVQSLQQHRGISANLDDQSLLHQGYWPFGRTNHYLFDLNRDFILGVHPETRGRVKAINRWHPQLMIDGHEMGPQNTYLFAPAREPINRNIAFTSKKWGALFAQDQAAAFDQQAWPYYTGEWFENLYPGYSSYAEFRGSIHILYEQARTAEDGVRTANGDLRTYQQSVHHQLTSTLSNLTTLATHSKNIYRDFVSDRRHVSSANSPYANTSFVVLPSQNRTRLRGFIELMELQNFELFTNKKELNVSNARDQLGNQLKKLKLPKGSLIIPNRQPEARLLAAILEFDASISDEVLIEERQKVLRDGSSLMYDTTAWNLSMMHGLTAYTINSYLEDGITPYQRIKVPANTSKPNPIAYLVDGMDDASVAFAARLMEQKIQVRIINKATELDGIGFNRGSIAVFNNDNKKHLGQLKELVHTTANELSLVLTEIEHGLGTGDFPDMGGSHFKLLKQPHVALVGRGGISPYDFGAIWHSIDSRLGIRHTQIDEADLSTSDLRRYNIIILPNRYEGSLSDSTLLAIDAWVRQGGTLIAIDKSTSQIVAPKTGLSRVRTLQGSFKDIQTYNISLQREWLAQQNQLDNATDVWSHLAPETLHLPFDIDEKPVKPEALKAQDDWQKMFMSSGAMVAGRVDSNHWLSFGSNAYIPILFAKNPILMSDDRSNAVIRLGVLSKIKNAPDKSNRKDSKNSPRKLGWSSLPEPYELQLRMSGLLWPEAAQRIANSAYLTREAKDMGQIILFATQPIFRGSTLATGRLLLNAIVFGPGLGTQSTLTL